MLHSGRHWLIRLDWKALSGTNTVAYYEYLYILDVKSFLTLGPDGQMQIEVSLMEEQKYLRLVDIWWPKFYALFNSYSCSKHR